MGRTNGQAIHNAPSLRHLGAALAMAIVSGGLLAASDESGLQAPMTKLSIVASLTTKSGYETLSGLLLADDGNFYGNTAKGGQFNWGTIFKVTPTGVVKPLHSFTIAEGYDHYVTAQGIDRLLYGYAGGYQNCGMIFSLSLDGSLSVVHQLAPDGSEGCYSTGFARTADGTLYDTSAYASGFTSHQVLRRVSPNGDFAVVADFGATGFNYPSAPLVGDDGDLYVTLINSGGNGAGNGAIAKVTPKGVIEILYEFQGVDIDGGFPVSALVYDAAHEYMYGTTYTTLFRYRDSNLQTVIGPPDNGSFGPLTLGPDGTHFYATHQKKIYSITPDGTVESIVRIPGKSRDEKLSFDAAGAMFGTTYDGGEKDLGSVFKVKGF